MTPNVMLCCGQLKQTKKSLMAQVTLWGWKRWVSLSTTNVLTASTTKENEFSIKCFDVEDMSKFAQTLSIVLPAMSKACEMLGQRWRFPSWNAKMMPVKRMKMSKRCRNKP
jgi:hypothetical protein